MTDHVDWDALMATIHMAHEDTVRLGACRPRPMLLMRIHINVLTRSFIFHSFLFPIIGAILSPPLQVFLCICGLAQVPRIRYHTTFPTDESGGFSC